MEMVSKKNAANWLSDKYPNVCGYKVVIDYQYSYVSFERVDDETEYYTFQESEADNVAESIGEIWLKGNLTQEEAVSAWVKHNLM